MDENSQEHSAIGTDHSPKAALQNPQTLGLAGLWTFGFLGLQDHRGLILGLMLMAVAAVLSGRAFFARALRTPAFFVFALLATYIVLRAMVAAEELPETTRDQIVYGAKMILPLLATPLVAWWLGGQPRRIAVLLALAITGLCIEFLVNVDWDRLGPMLGGQRGNILASGLAAAFYAGLALLAWTIGLPTALRWLRDQRHFLRYFLGGIGAAAVIVLVAALLITASRAVVAMLLILLPAIVFWQLRRRGNADPSARRRYGLPALMASMILLIGGAALGERVSDRFARGVETINRIIVEDADQAELSGGIAVRIRALELGTEVASSRPVFGWGPGTSTTGDLQNRFEAKVAPRVEHLHNAYLEIWIRLGGTGFFLYLLAFGFSARPAIQSVRAGRMPPEVMVFLISSTVLMAGWCFINYRMTNPSFSFWLSVMLGMALTFALQATAATSDSDGRIDPRKTDRFGTGT